MLRFGNGTRLGHCASYQKTCATTRIWVEYVQLMGEQLVFFSMPPIRPSSEIGTEIGPRRRLVGVANKSARR